MFISPEKVLAISRIHKIVGEKFNIGSPKQLGDILFTKLKLPYGKKGKSGNFQTDVKILEKLNGISSILQMILMTSMVLTSKH